MSGIVERVTLRFPGQSNIGQAAAPLACGIPGPTSSSGALAPAADAAALASRIQTAEKSVQKINVPHQANSQGPVRAIAIAPDSAIACCDVWTGGRGEELERHRISPGNPALGSWSVDDIAFISIPESLPQIPSANGDVKSVFWDSTLIVPSTDAALSMVGFPLRLELWRGDILPIRSPRRAPYLAKAIYRMLLGDASGSRVLYVCTDGRQKIDITAALTARQNANDKITVTAFQITSLKGTNPQVDDLCAEQLALDDAGDMSVDIGPTVTLPLSKTFSFSGNPIPILKIVITPTLDAASTGPTEFQLRVRAED